MPSARDCLRVLPPPLLSALRGIDDARLYLVGGCVRDALLGRSNHDLDLAVEGDAQATARALAARLHGTVVPLDPEHGTYRLALREPIGPIAHLDLTRLRAEPIEADLRARDLTINAIAVPLAGEPRLLDPTGGERDLVDRVVRAASAVAFVGDPLRLLRAVRFAVELDYRIEPETRRLAREAAPLLAGMSPERQRDEFARILATDRAAAGVRELDDLGLLGILVPDLDAARGCTQPVEHFYDVFEHSLETLAALDLMLSVEPPLEPAAAARWRALWQRLGQAGELRARLDAPLAEERPRRASLKLAGLLHDIAKPETKTVDPETGRMRFYGHPEVGAKRSAARARTLRFANREIQYLALLVEEHLRPGMLAAPGEVPTRRALYRFSRDLGDAVPDLLLLNFADHAAARGPRLTQAEWVAHVDYGAWLLHTLSEEEGISRPPKLIDGDDLMRELDLPPGPLIGRLLEAIHEAQAAAEVRTREDALTLAREMLRRR